MANQWAGRNLAVTIAGTAVPCPQSLTLTPAQDFAEYYCPGTTDKQRVLIGTGWSGSLTFFPEDDDHADVTAFNTATAVAIVAYPDGNTAGKIKATFNAYCACSLDTNSGNVASATVTFTIDGAVTFAAATGS